MSPLSCHSLFTVGDRVAVHPIARRYDRYAHLAMAAAKTAMEDGGLSADAVDSKRFGVLIGSGVGGLEAVETSCRILRDKGPKRISPFLLPS